VEKAILLEMEGGRAVVLTPQGEFRRIPVPPGTWEIGDEVTLQQTRPAIPWFRWRWAPSAVAAVLLVLLMPLGYQSWALAQPFAIITLDINPSVQLTVNERDEVIKVEGLNSDGNAIVSGVDWKRHPVGEVLETLTAKAVEAGKLNPADAESVVLVAVAPANHKELTTTQSEKLVAATRQGVDSALAKEARKKNVEAKTQVAVLKATAAERDDASKEGLDVGKSVLKKELEARKPELKAEQIKKRLTDSGPGQVLKDLLVNPSEFLKNAEEKRSPAKDEKKDAAGEPAEPASGKAEPNPVGVKPEKETPKKDTPPGQEKGKDSEPKGKDQEKAKGQEKGSAPQNGKGGEVKEKEKDSSESWKVPIFGITIPKPQLFRREKEPAAPTQPPRTDSSGAGAPLGVSTQVESERAKPAAVEDKPSPRQEAETRAKPGNSEVASDRAEVKSDMPEVKSDQPGVKSDKSEVKSDKSEVKSDKPEVKREKPEAKPDKP